MSNMSEVERVQPSPISPTVYKEEPRPPPRVASKATVTGTPTPSSASDAPQSEQVRFTKSYIFSIGGLLRLTIILSQFAGWISAAAVPKIYNGIIYLPTELDSTRDAYLVFSVVGFLIAISIYVLFLFNFNNIGFVALMPMNLIIVVTDVVWLVPTFILSIVCAVRESGVKNPSFFYSPYVNVGAFAAAAFFGFLCSLVYAVDAIFHFIKQRRVKNP